MSERPKNIPLLRWTRVCASTCRQAVLVDRKLNCRWCGSRTKPLLMPEEPSPLSTQDLVGLHGYCRTEGVPTATAIAGVWRRRGFDSLLAAVRHVHLLWRQMGLAVPSNGPAPTAPGTSLTYHGLIKEEDLVDEQTREGGGTAGGGARRADHIRRLQSMAESEREVS